ncbi:hypothetical protein ACFYUR_19200 [Micromonospora haikouensis]|uniref:hypothetical protein n=1 Tax=Micromonospora haikouensis TaxID=686309 RepID=UPI0036CBE133
MDEEYRWDDDSYTAVATNHVAWQHVTYILRQAHPKIRQHVGSVLRITAAAPDGQILAVTLIEEADDHYLVVAARHLTGDELTYAEALLRGH